MDEKELDDRVVRVLQSDLHDEWIGLFLRDTLNMRDTSWIEPYLTGEDDKCRDALLRQPSPKVRERFVKCLDQEVPVPQHKKRQKVSL